jgi:LysM repeat protein
VVKSGDNLTRIAKAHGTTVKALKAANGLENDRIVVGAKLKIPTA